jgi:hypothetical protein
VHPGAFLIKGQGILEVLHELESPEPIRKVVRSGCLN